MTQNNRNKKYYYNKKIEVMASKKGYDKKDIVAAFEYYNRKVRNCHPPGEFDSVKRFYAEERTERVESVCSPTRRFPYSEMKTARTAEHCAEVFGATSLHVKRIYKVIKNVVHTGNKCRQAELIAELKVSTRVQIEEPRRERPIGRQVTKPTSETPVVSDKKPLNPLRELAQLGFKPMKIVSRGNQSELVSAYKLAAGYIILSSQDGKSLPLAISLSLSFVTGAHKENEDVIVKNCRSLNREELHKITGDAIERYGNSKTL